jgi:hypothetical protein
MRKRFDPQLKIGQRPIEETPINLKDGGIINELVAALKAFYLDEECNSKVFKLLRDSLQGEMKKDGRPGMDMWSIFVLAQLRLCTGCSYSALHDYANNHLTIRWLMGVECEYGFKRIEFSYQNIYDNLSKVSDELVDSINSIIVDFGHGKVFKKKETAPLNLKTDSFVVESNVHFPTDYNLLWDCARKCLDAVSQFLEKYNGLPGWRKIGSWYREMKGLMRELGKAGSSGGRNKQERVFSSAERYVRKATALLNKLDSGFNNLPINDEGDLLLGITLEHFKVLMEKHIDLVGRRLMKGEKIPHDQKMFSVFETYTEWVTKGKTRPNVELGKKLAITTDQFNLIVDYQIMDGEQDRDIVIELADRVLQRHPVASWSFDKGFWNKENKEVLQLVIPKVVMPKLGKLNSLEKDEEGSLAFKRFKNQHSAIESNINELENRGLDRCPDRGVKNYRRYIALGVCAYNLKKIGRQIIQDQRDAKRVRQNLSEAA